jgi:hypothetical protein
MESKWIVFTAHGGLCGRRRVHHGGMLLWIMQYLIATGVDAVTEEHTFRFVDFVRVQRDERVQTRDEKVERVKDAQPPPARATRATHRRSRCHRRRERLESLPRAFPMR